MAIDWHGPLPLENFWTGRNSQPVDLIIIHTTVGWISAADARFHNPDSRVSAHYGVRIDGSIWQWVNEADTAYHSGELDVNYRSIGIEHEDGGAYDDPRPDALYAASARIVRETCDRHGIPIDRAHIIGHREVHATACPDALDIDRIVREAKQEVPVTDDEFLEKLARLYAPKLQTQLEDTVYAPLADLRVRYERHFHDTTIPKPQL